MHRIAALPVLAALAFLAPAALATTARPKEVRCPVCGKTITVLQIGCAEHGEEGRTAWVLAGFREAGYDVADLAADDAVPVLLSALSDERDHVRWNAFRALREKTGLSIGRDAFTEYFSKPHELKAAIARWRRHFAR
jgi:hypothetical protein